jgi:hypothetical protein
MIAGAVAVLYKAGEAVVTAMQQVAELPQPLRIRGRFGGLRQFAVGCAHGKVR